MSGVFVRKHAKMASSSRVRFSPATILAISFIIIILANNNFPYFHRVNAAASTHSIYSTSTLEQALNRRFSKDLFTIFSQNSGGESSIRSKPMIIVPSNRFLIPISSNAARTAAQKSKPSEEKDYYHAKNSENAPRQMYKLKIEAKRNTKAGCQSLKQQAMAFRDIFKKDSNGPSSLEQKLRYYFANCINPDGFRF